MQNTTRHLRKRRESSMQSSNFAYVNGRFVPENEATVSIFDRGFLYGDGCFETMRVYGGKIFRLTKHIVRLCDGLQRVGIQPPGRPGEIKAMLEELVRHNQVADGMARVYVTSGSGDFNRLAAEYMQPTIVALALPLNPRLQKN